MRFCSLGSGSTGNAHLVEGPRGYVLVDAGFSWRGVKSRARKAGIALDSVEAVILTHEHTDHVRGLGTLVRRGVPVYGSRGTLAALGLKGPKVHPLDGETEIAGLRVRSFPLPHDASDPRGLCISDGEGAVGIVTDLGSITDAVLSGLRGCGVLLFEANHDPELLLAGRYPWHLKLRIMGPLGHLSNGEAGRALALLASRGVRAVLLAHISRENNRPGLALETVARHLRDWDGSLYLTYPDRPSAVVEDG
ncbi:MBL fold metallo-hydrolase [Candidatus Bipolaricaulota bacterium]|nr:MBL fold metallo-hydrolase [Candidatus Bipolaricaulota bacterium]